MSERNLLPPSPWWWRQQILWNVGAYLPDCTVPQLRISLVSDQCGVHKTNSNTFHIYTLGKLRFIQSITVTHHAQGWDTSAWEFRIWSPSCKNAVIEKSNYCSWPAWPWRQRHYNPSKCWELLAQLHNITILQTGIYAKQDSCWLRILRSHVWDVTV